MSPDKKDRRLKREFHECFKIEENHLKTNDGKIKVYYRYYSLFNGSRGTWLAQKGDAIKEGKRHQALITEAYFTFEV